MQAYSREAIAHHEAGHATARFVVYGSTGATSIRAEGEAEGDTWGCSEAERLPDSLMTARGNVRSGPYSRSDSRLLSQAIVCNLAGSAAEAMLLGRATPDAAWEIFLTKADDQAFVWELAGKRWVGHPERRDRMVQLLAAVAVRLIMRNQPRIHRVANALLERELLTAAEVRALM